MPSKGAIIPKFEGESKAAPISFNIASFDSTLILKDKVQEFSIKSH